MPDDIQSAIDELNKQFMSPQVERPVLPEEATKAPMPAVRPTISESKEDISGAIEELNKGLATPVETEKPKAIPEKKGLIGRVLSYGDQPAEGAEGTAHALGGYVKTGFQTLPNLAIRLTDVVNKALGIPEKTISIPGAEYAKKTLEPPPEQKEAMRKLSETTPGAIAGAVAAAPGSIMPYMLGGGLLGLTKLPGLVKSIGLMTGIGAVERSDKGVEAVLKGLPEDALIGSIFHYLGPAFKLIKPGEATSTGKILEEGGMEVTRGGLSRPVRAGVMSALFAGQSLYGGADIKEAFSSGFVGALLGLHGGKGIKKGIYENKLLPVSKREKEGGIKVSREESGPSPEDMWSAVTPDPEAVIKDEYTERYIRYGEEYHGETEPSAIPSPEDVFKTMFRDWTPEEIEQKVKSFQLSQNGFTVWTEGGSIRFELNGKKNGFSRVETLDKDGNPLPDKLDNNQLRKLFGLEEINMPPAKKVIPVFEGEEQQVGIKGIGGKKIDVFKEGAEKEVPVKKPEPGEGSPPANPPPRGLPPLPGEGLDILDLHSKLNDPKEGGYNVPERTTGFNVGQGGFEPLDNPTPKDLENHYRDNAKAYEGFDKGGWKDPETGKVWVEPSKNFDSLTDAMKDGIKKDQTSIYNNKKKDSIYLKTPDGKTKIFELDKNDNITMKSPVEGAEFWAVREGYAEGDVDPRYEFNDSISGSTFSVSTALDPKEIKTELDSVRDRFLTPGSGVTYKGERDWFVNERTGPGEDRWTIYKKDSPGKLIEAGANDIRVPGSIELAKERSVQSFDEKGKPKLRAIKDKELAAEYEDRVLMTLTTYSGRTVPERFGESPWSGTEGKYYANNKPFYKEGWLARRWYTYAQGQPVEPMFQHMKPRDITGRFRIFDSRKASPEELKIFESMKNKLADKFSKEFGFNRTMPQEAAELDYAAAKELGYDGLNNGRAVALFKPLENIKLKAVVSEGKNTGRDARGNLIFKGKKIHELSPEEFKEFGDEHDVPNLGPETTSKIVEGERIPGGLEGKFTFLDLLRMKVEPIDIRALYERSEEAVTKLYEKLLKTLTPRMGDNIESFNRFVFGMMSAHTTLLSNEVAYRRVSPRNIEEIKKLANLLPDNPTPEQRKNVDRALRKKYGMLAKGEGEERATITEKGIGEGADLSNISSLARLWLKDPTWFNKTSSESWETFANRVSSQTRGLGTKTAVFGGVFQSPWEAGIGAVDTHVSKIFRERILSDPAMKNHFESSIVDKYNEKLAEAKTLTREYKRFLREIKKKEPDLEGLKYDSEKEYREALKKLPEPSNLKAKTIDDVFQYANGELDNKQVSTMDIIDRAISRAMSPRRTPLKEGIPESLEKVKFIESPEQFKMMSDAYSASMKALREDALKLGVKEFPAQWILWDQWRGRFEPHETMFPGLYKLPKLSLEQSNQAMRINEILGYNQRRGVTPPILPGIIKPQDIFYKAGLDYANGRGAERISPDQMIKLGDIAQQIGGHEVTVTFPDKIIKDEDTIASLIKFHKMSRKEAEHAFMFGQYTLNEFGALVELGRDAILKKGNEEAVKTAIHESLHFVEETKLSKAEISTLERWMPDEEARVEKISKIIYNDLYGKTTKGIPQQIMDIVKKIADYIKEFGRYLIGRGYRETSVDQIIKDIETGKIAERKVFGPAKLEPRFRKGEGEETTIGDILNFTGKRFPEGTRLMPESEREALLKKHREERLLKRLEEKAYRSETGYQHGEKDTAADVVRYEQEELGNKLGVSEETLRELEGRPASDMVWVTEKKEDALKYGGAAEYELPKESRVIAEDGEGGYLVLKGTRKLRATTSVEREVRDDIRGASLHIKGAFDGLKRLFMPGSRGPSGERSVIIAGKELAKMERSHDVFDKAMDSAEKAFDKMPIESQYAFSQAASAGTSQATPELEGLRRQFKRISDEKAAMINSFDPEGLMKVRENYWPGADNAAYQAAHGREQGVLPPTRIMEPTGFMKPKDFQEFNDMLNAGYVPTESNPVRQFRQKMLEWDKFIYTHKMLQQLELTGDAVKTESGVQVPAGWRAVPPPYGVTKTGRYIMTDQAAQVFENWLSRPISSNRYFGELYRGYMNAATTLQRAQLFGFFHGGFVTAESVVSRGALALKQGYRVLTGQEDLGTFLKTAATVPLAPYQKFKMGKEMHKEWMEPGTSTDPKVIQAVNDIILGGGGVAQEKMFTNFYTESMKKDFREGKNISGALKSPLAAMEIIMKPLMQTYVPRLKLGAFEELSTELRRAKPDLSDAEYSKEMHQIWNRIDDRLGQVRWQRIFMNNTAKNLTQMLIRAPGWTGGTILEIGGAPKDAKNFVKEWAKTGKAPATMPDRVAYVLSLAASTMMANAALTCILAKKDPSELSPEDYMAFQTGDIDERGKPMRGMLPLYSKDVYAYSKAPVSTIWHKMNPIIGLIYELSQNKDYYGTGIIDPSKGQGEKIGEIGQYLAKAMIPFGYRGFEKISEERGVTPGGVIGPAIGVMPAPAYFSQTKAMQKALELGALKMPTGGRTHEEYERNRLLNTHIKRYMAALSSGKPVDEALSGLKEDVASGKLKMQDVMKFKTKLKHESIESSISRLSMDQALAVWRLANDEEKRKIVPIIFKKYRNLKDPREKQEYTGEIEKISGYLSKIYNLE